MAQKLIDNADGSYSPQVVVAGTVPVTVSNTNPSASQTNPAVGTTSGQLVAANAARKLLVIQNKSTTDSVYIQFGAAATVAGGFEIKPGATFSPNIAPTNAINAIAAVAVSGVIVIEA